MSAPMKKVSKKDLVMKPISSQIDMTYLQSQGILRDYVTHNYNDGTKPKPITECCISLMKRRDVASFKVMKDPVTIYRGASIKELDYGFGQSWTTSKYKAKKFAFHYSGHSKSDSVVFEAAVSKVDIYAYVNDRRENECIVNPEALTDVKISKTYKTVEFR